MDTTAWAYSDNVKDHFMHPRNILEDESTYQEDGKGMVGNPSCGDMMLVVIKVDKTSDRITDCRWKTYGCASAIASTSMMSVMVTENGGMTLDEAYGLTPQRIMERLGGLPNNKVHCSVLGDRALREAIQDYYRRSGRNDKIQEESVQVVCSCLNITDKDIEEAVLEGADSFARLQEMTKIATVCGKCREAAIEHLETFKKKYYSR